MSHKKFSQIDADTGEVVDGFVAYVMPKRKNGFVEGWFAMAQSALTIMKHFTRVEDFRVLMAMLEQLDFENLISVSQVNIASDLSMNKSQVSRAIKRLIAAGALFEGPKIGVNRSYRLNPNFGWKGSAKNHKFALSEERKQRMAAARISGVIDGDKDPNQTDIEDFLK